MLQSPESPRPLGSSAGSLRPRGWAELNSGRRRVMCSFAESLRAEFLRIVARPLSSRLSRVAESLRGDTIRHIKSDGDTSAEWNWARIHGINPGEGAVPSELTPTPGQIQSDLGGTGLPERSKS